MLFSCNFLHDCMNYSLWLAGMSRHSFLSSDSLVLQHSVATKMKSQPFWQVSGLCLCCLGFSFSSCVFYSLKQVKPIILTYLVSFSLTAWIYALSVFSNWIFSLYYKEDLIDSTTCRLQQQQQQQIKRTFTWRKISKGSKNNN